MKFFSGIGEKLRDGLRRSQEFLGTGLQSVMEPERPIDETLWEELEEVLAYVADGVGVAVVPNAVVTRGLRTVTWDRPPAENTVFAVRRVGAPGQHSIDDLLARLR